MFLRDEAAQTAKQWQQSNSPDMVESGKKLQRLLDSGTPLLDPLLDEMGCKRRDPQNLPSKRGKR